MTKETILLLTCSVGYGHDVAIMNIRQALEARHPHAQFITIDTEQYLPKLGKMLTDRWDAQVRQGNFSMVHLITLKNWHERLFKLFPNPALKKHLKQLFNTHAITAVWDAQPLYTPLLYHILTTLSPRPLDYHKVLTDLPTEHNQLYLNGLKALTPNAHIRLHVHCPPPLSHNGQAARFWQQQTALSSTHFASDFAYPVHQAYLNKPSTPDVWLDVPPEWVTAADIPPDAIVTTLMLGSQGVEAILGYTEAFIRSLAKAPASPPRYLFIGCAKNQSLYQAVNALIASHQSTLGPHRIIPLTMQPMKNLASLMWRSNRVLIRSSGISSLEQLAMQQAGKTLDKLWIHAPYAGKLPSLDEPGLQSFLLSKTQGWERGNAAYLQHYLKGELVTPGKIDFVG